MNPFSGLHVRHRPPAYRDLPPDSGLRLPQIGGHRRRLRSLQPDRFRLAEPSVPDSRNHVDGHIVGPNSKVGTLTVTAA